MAPSLPREFRLAAATVLAPPIAVVGIGFLFTGNTIFFWPILSGVLVIAYLAMIVLGLPTHALLVHTTKRGPVLYLACGAILGAVIASALAIILDPDIGHSVEEMASAGAICATLFWLIRRPDLDLPNPARSAQ